MANTYTQLLVQLIFAVQGRKNLIRPDLRERVEKYICGIVSNIGSKPLAIYCNPDHCHVLIGLNPNTSVSDMARLVKSNSSKWINKERLIRGFFTWQKGFGGFSYSKSQLDRVVKYILNQPVHHQTKSFRQEYLELLEEFNVDYDERYVFEFYDD